jgi:hypothetical protein
MQLVPLHLGGTLVATSNAAPEELYEGGINRAAFLPFIGTLRARCAVVSLDYHDDDVEAEAGVHAGAVVAEAIAAGAVVAGAPGRGSSRDELAELRRRRTEGIDYRRQLAGRERVEVADSGGAVRSSSSGRERQRRWRRGRRKRRAATDVGRGGAGGWLPSRDVADDDECDDDECDDDECDYDDCDDDECNCDCRRSSCGG